MPNKITLLFASLSLGFAVGAQSLKPVSNNNNSSNHFYYHDMKGNTAVAMPPPSYDTCTNAIDINSLFGGSLNIEMVAGPYDNSNATTDLTEPSTGWGCFGEPNGSGTAPELNKTVWFKFTGDGGYYYVETGTCAGVTNYINDGDTQFALYTGTCGSLTSFKCSEDGPNSTSTDFPAGFPFLTTFGTSYYLMVDGFSFLGNVSDGEFCIKVTHLPIVPCGDPSVSVGTTTQNHTTFCFMEGDTFQVNVAGSVAPNVGDYSGISMVLSNAPLSTANPIIDPAAIYFFGLGNPVPSTFIRKIYNTGSIIASTGTYYFTPILFGNAYALNTPTKYLNDLVLDPSCITFGNPAIFTVLPQSDPFCTVGITENNKSKNLRLHVYPSPATEGLNIEFVSPSETKATFKVTDLLGRIMFNKYITLTEGINKNSFNVKQLAQGIYIVAVSDENGLRTMRFQKE